MIGQIALPVPFAALSWYLFEQPILGLKKHFEVSDTRAAAAPQVAALAAEAGD
jgi:peptidoglycan/LPS O-acetylase OafA/YrhL